MARGPKVSDQIGFATFNSFDFMMGSLKHTTEHGTNLQCYPIREHWKSCLVVWYKSTHMPWGKLRSLSSNMVDSHHCPTNMENALRRVVMIRESLHAGTFLDTDGKKVKGIVAWPPLQMATTCRTSWQSSSSTRETPFACKRRIPWYIKISQHLFFLLQTHKTNSRMVLTPWMFVPLLPVGRL